MHIDTIPNRKSRPAYLLRESVRDGKHVRKRTLANLSSLPIEQIEAIRRILKGERLGPIEDGLEVVRSRAHGHVEAVRTAMKRLGFDKLIDARASCERISRITEFEGLAREANEGGRVDLALPRAARGCRRACGGQGQGLRLALSRHPLTAAVRDGTLERAAGTGEWLRGDRTRECWGRSARLGAQSQRRTSHFPSRTL